jgi:hypothetical protein
MPLRRRVIALAAAYAIALSSVITNFSAAQAAAETTNQLDGVLCHSSVAEQPAPRSDESNGKICVDWCCVGCLTMATAVPSPMPAAALPHSLSQRLTPLVRVVLAGSTDFNAHRSRGPPPAL